MKINSCFLSFSQAVEVINEEVILRKKRVSASTAFIVCKRMSLQINFLVILTSFTSIFGILLKLFLSIHIKNIIVNVFRSH